jgi:hypothetical protein
LSSNNITRVFINEQESVDKTDWVINQDGEVLVPVNDLAGGDKVIITIDNENDEYQEGCLLSIFNKDVYKDLSLEVEAEFSKTLNPYPQNIELICRATSTWDKRFLADEYYAFGIKDSRCYLAKVSYHSEDENSFAYKQMLNIGSEDEQVFYFKELTDDQQTELDLTGFKYRYNEKYIFKAVIEGDSASFYAKRLSSSGSLAVKTDWVTLFEDVNVRVDKENISNRTFDLGRTVHVTEPIIPIESAGFYGLTVPNSYVKVYRVEVESFDEQDVRVFDELEYSKKVATEFSETYKTNNKLKFASSDSRVENRTDIVEVFDVENGSFVFDLGLKAEDVERVTVNNISLQSGIDYVDKFVTVNNTLEEEYEGSEIGAYVDSDHTDVIGQKQVFASLGKGDGISKKFRIDEDSYQKVRYYPNGKVDDVLVEFDSKFILNTLGKVGLKEDLDNFITKETLMKQFNGRKFYVELVFRGKDMVVDMGTISSGKFVYDFLPELTTATHSYDSLWKYKHAEWIDAFYARYKGTWIDGVDRHAWNARDPIGYVLSTLNMSDVEFLIRSNYTPDFEELAVLPEGLSDILNRIPREQVKAILRVFRFDVRFSNVIIESYLRSTRLRVTLDSLATREEPTVTDPSYFDYVPDQSDLDYLEFREKWLEFEVYNNQFGLFIERKFYYSLFDDEFNVSDDVVQIYNPPSTNRQVKLRAFYDTFTVLTDGYDPIKTVYTVDEGIQDLHDETVGEKGLSELFIGLDINDLGVMGYDGITYIAVPNSLVNDNLYADIDICGPYFREDTDLTRNVRVPLKLVSEVLEADPSKNKQGQVYSGSNRNYDFLNDADEYSTGDDVLGDFTFPRIFPTPDDTAIIEGDAFTVSEVASAALSGDDKTNFFLSLFSDDVDGYLLDRFLNVASWYNEDDTVYSPYHKRIIKNIVDIKSLNRSYGEFNSTFLDPFMIEQWFHGFYSGESSSWYGEVNISGGTVAVSGGLPWGTQNSKKDLFDQIKGTIDGKFSDYTLYYLDLSKYHSSNKTSNGTVDGGVADPSVYPISGNAKLIKNPEVDNDLENKINPTYPEGYLSFTSETEFPMDNVEALDSSNYDVTITRIHRFFEDEDELNWDYNHMIMLKDDSKFNQEGSYLSSEFEYSHDQYTNPNNSLERISQKVSLGENDGTSDQLFPNPNVSYRQNVKYSKVHDIWVDNYIDENYSILTRDDGNVQFELDVNDVSDNIYCAVTYKSSNYLELNNYNKFIDNFNNQRDLKWVTLTRDRFGFIQKPSEFDGYEVDTSVVDGHYVWKKSIGASTVSTAGTSKASSLIQGYRIGDEDEDVIEVIDLKRNNNFEVSVDVYFDEEETKDNMVAGLILRGDFNLLDDKQYMTDYYTLLLNFQGDNITLIGNQLVEKTFIDGDVLVSVSDESSLIKRGVFYTLRVSVIKDEMKVYLSERDKEEKFYFSYNFSGGINKTNLEDVVTTLRGGLGVNDTGKVMDIGGDRIGLFSRGNMTYFMDFQLKAFEYDTISFGDPFVYKNYDAVISSLRATYGIDGDFKKMRKTPNGYEYMLLGNTLFSRIIDGTFQQHSFIVDDFEVIGNYVYSVERKEESSLKVINAYERIFKRKVDFNIDSKQFINEPVISYLNDLNASVVSIVKQGDSLFIETSAGVQTPLTWDSMVMPWDFYTEPWNVYG